MKDCSNYRVIFSRIAMAMMIGFVSLSTVSACPDCQLKNSGGIIEPSTVMSKLAFSISTLLLLGIFFAIMGFLISAMVKACRDLAQDRMNKEHSLPALESERSFRMDGMP